jgi:hypothetical protein
MLSDVFHTNRQTIRHIDLDYGSYRLPDLEKKLPAGVTDR